ncbi:MAG: hypothetical protein ABW179_08380, partial [Methylobacterium sp.]
AAIVPWEDRSDRFRIGHPHPLRAEHPPREHHWHAGVAAHRGGRPAKSAGAEKRSVTERPARAS